MPGYVYELEIDTPDVCTLVDPIKEVVNNLPEPYDDFSYQHDGEQDFLKGVVEGQISSCQVIFPPGANPTPRQPNLTEQLETLVRALRDAEILVLGNVPASSVRNRYEVS